jgi:hypothetical protein
MPSFTERTIDELVIDDESSFRHVALYADLKEVLRRAGYRFRVLPGSKKCSPWDRALLLNLTFWSADAGGDVLVDDHLAADVVAHAAWHHLAARALAPAIGAPSPTSLFVGESIASAFDLWLVGRLLGHAPTSTFLETQVSAMADAADAAGMDAGAFEALLESVAADPERAFADLCVLLFRATTSLFACASVEDGLAALTVLEDHRFAALLHHYELSSWVLYARAYGAKESADGRADEVVRAMSGSDPLAWLTKAWLAPALDRVE